MRRNWYITTSVWLGSAALIAALIAILFPIIARTAFTEEQQAAVLTQAIPFFAAFVCILLLYILVIVLVAIWLTGVIPHRIYHPIDVVITVSIILGVIFLFQPFLFVAYRYGFIVLLSATLLNILWSHTIPRAAKADIALPRIALWQQIVALACAAVVFVLLFTALVQINQPVEPYGLRTRLWNSYDDAQKAEIAAAAQAEYSQQIIPFLLVLNLIPAALVFFTIRGILDAFRLRSLGLLTRSGHEELPREHGETGGEVVGAVG
jgi:hypothetical protein